MGYGTRKDGVKIGVCTRADLVKEKTGQDGVTYFCNQLTKKVARTQDEAGFYPPLMNFDVPGCRAGETVV